MTRYPTHVLIGSIAAAVIGCGGGSGNTKAKDEADEADEVPVQRELSKRARANMSKEARTNVPAIAIAVQTVFDERMQAADSAIPELPESAPMTPPTGTCCKEPQGECGIGKGDWTHPAWVALRFRPSTAHRYSYEYVADDEGFVVRAVGDLDCDGELSTYELRGRITDSGELDIDREPTEDDPFE